MFRSLGPSPEFDTSPVYDPVYVHQGRTTVTVQGEGALLLESELPFWARAEFLWGRDGKQHEEAKGNV